MQNKPNFQDTQMNVSIFSKMDYENKSNWTLSRNKPNLSLPKGDQTQFMVSKVEPPVVSLPALSKVEVSNLFPGFPFCNMSQNGVPPIILVSSNWLCIISFSVMVTAEILMESI